MDDGKCDHSCPNDKMKNLMPPSCFDEKEVSELYKNEELFRNEQTPGEGLVFARSHILAVMVSISTVQITGEN